MHHISEKKAGQTLAWETCSAQGSSSGSHPSSSFLRGTHLLHGILQLGEEPAEVASGQIWLIFSPAGVEARLSHPEETHLNCVRTSTTTPCWSAVAALLLTEGPVLEGGKSVPDLEGKHLTSLIWLL